MSAVSKIAGNLAAEVSQPVDPRVAKAAEALQGDGVVAILFYGSALWKAQEEDSVLDFYVLCDELKTYGLPWLSRGACHALPPNVYFRQGEGWRAKVAVMQLDSFRREAQGKGLTPHIWARFAQPCRIVHAKNEGVRQAVLESLAEALLTFHRHALRTRPVPADASSLWKQGMQLTFAYELRSEPPQRIDTIIEMQRATFEQRTEWVREAVPELAPGTSHKALRLRGLRTRLSKFIHLIRLMKASFTYAGGVDYILWKIARHSGVQVQATDFQRRHPLIAGWSLLWKLWRKKGFR